MQMTSGICASIHRTGTRTFPSLSYMRSRSTKTLLSLSFTWKQAGVIHTELYQEESNTSASGGKNNELRKAVNSNTDATQAEIDAAAASPACGTQRTALEGSDGSLYILRLRAAKNSWYTSPVMVTLSPAAIAEYSLDGGVTWAVYSAPVTLDQEGTNKVKYRRSVEPGEAKTLEIKIDRTAPVVQITDAASTRSIKR